MGSHAARFEDDGLVLLVSGSVSLSEDGSEYEVGPLEVRCESGRLWPYALTAVQEVLAGDLLVDAERKQSPCLPYVLPEVAAC